jgi:uncharacterized protein (TIRG00374 family)
MGMTSGRKVILLLLKVTVSGALLAFILRKAGIGNIVAHLRGMDIRFFLLASVISLIVTFLTSFRWGMLLGGKHSLGKLYSLSLIGMFFSNLLPGAVGGDAVKIYYLYQETRQGGLSLGSVFMDRYIGYFGLLSLGLAGGIAAFRDLSAVHLQWAAPLLFVMFLAGSFVVFGARIGRRFSSVASFYEYFHDILRDRPLMMKAYAVSLVVQVLTVLSVYLIARGMGQHPPLGALFVFVPIVITVMMIPISISGLGLREGAFVLLFGLIGIPPEAATSISFLWFLAVAAASLVGLVEYFRFRKVRSA